MAANSSRHLYFITETALSADDHWRRSASKDGTSLIPGGSDRDTLPQRYATLSVAYCPQHGLRADDMSTNHPWYVEKSFEIRSLLQTSLYWTKGVVYVLLYVLQPSNWLHALSYTSV